MCTVCNQIRQKGQIELALTLSKITGDSLEAINDQFDFNLSDLLSGQATGFPKTDKVSNDVPGDTSTTETMEVGSTYNGTLESAGDRDWIAITLEAGQYYQINLDGVTFNDTYLRIYDADGKLVSFNDDNGPNLGTGSAVYLYAATSGTYYISAGSYADRSSGDYKITASAHTPDADDFGNDIASAETLTANTAQSGQINTAGDSDYFKLAVTAGQSYTFSATGNLSSLAPDLQFQTINVYDEAGNLVYSSTGEKFTNAFSFTASSTGSYYLEIKGHEDKNIGEYNVAAWEGADSGDSLSDPQGTLELDAAPLKSTLEYYGDNDYFSLTTQTGTKANTITITDADGNPISGLVLAVYDSNNKLVKASTSGELKFNSSGSADYTIRVLDSPANFVGEYNLTYTNEDVTTPAGTIDDIAEYLKTGFWGSGPYAWPTDKEITFDISKLGDAESQQAARMALQLWSDITGLTFTEVTGGAKLDFDDENSGAYASFNQVNGVITSASINVSKTWSNRIGTFNDYLLQTYIHEIGHALGLGHAGNYNGSASYPADATFLNDSWQWSVMSYFSQRENTNVNADFAYVLTPQMADILAVWGLYGKPTNIRSGDTVYGFNSNAGSPVYDFTNYAEGDYPTFTLVDSGGYDVLNFSQLSQDQTISLIPETFSSVGGKLNNIGIMRGTIIEAVRTGSGNDTVTGNDADNAIATNDGNDTVNAGAGNDWVSGGAGNDTINGEGGDDSLYSGSGDDTVSGGAGNDALFGGSGNDTLNGDEGNDVLRGDEGADKLYGGAGDDNAAGGAGNDELYGGEGNDWLGGGGGDDVLRGEAGDDKLDGGAGDDDLKGGAGRDELHGGAGTDTVEGGAESDIIRGDGGEDKLYGEAGDDGIAGGADNDELYGGEGNDWLGGGTGDDKLDGGAGDDRLDGGAGTDTAVFTGRYEDYVLNTASGRNQLNIRDTRANGDGTDVLDNVEILQFSNGTARYENGTWTFTASSAAQSTASSAQSKPEDDRAPRQAPQSDDLGSDGFISVMDELFDFSKLTPLEEFNAKASNNNVKADLALAQRAQQPSALDDIRKQVFENTTYEDGVWTIKDDDELVW